MLFPNLLLAAEGIWVRKYAINVTGGGHGEARGQLRVLLCLSVSRVRAGAVAQGCWTTLVSVSSSSLLLWLPESGAPEESCCGVSKLWAQQHQGWG